MTTFDLIVLGAGPAGAEAAILAASRGLSVALVDEEHAAGGQVYRAPAHGGLVKPDADAQAGTELRRRLAAGGVHCLFGARTWHVERGFRLMAVSGHEAIELNSRAMIVATGAIERHCPFPGWTLPGVIGLAAATILLKAHRALPGKRIVVAGSGPLLPLVAVKALDLGADVACVVDAARRRDWLAKLPTIVRSPGLALRGGGWMAKLARRRVPVLYGSAVRRAEGSKTVEKVVIGPVARDWSQIAGKEITVAADALCVGFGLVPSTDATRLLGADHQFDRSRGGWTVITDHDGRTSVAALYVCGDAAGVAGAAAAPHSGRLAALAAARDLDVLGNDDYRALARRERTAALAKGRFGFAMTALATPKAGSWGWSDADTVICRCEGVRRGAIEQAFAAGARTIDDAKSATRCGMGPCGGRICAEACGAILAELGGCDCAVVGQATGRPPLRPVALDDIAGAFEYDQLPFPAPAPL